MSKDVSAGNTGAKKPRGKPFAKGNKPVNAFTSGDPRANQHGQRNKAAVETQAQLRALYVAVLHEAINTPLSADMSNLEFIARQHVKGAKSGVKDERETMLDRIWGKATQSVEVGGPNGGPIKTENVDLNDTARLERLMALAEVGVARINGRGAGGGGGAPAIAVEDREG